MTGPMVSETTDYVEYFGTELHGIEFIDVRSISVADAKRGWELDIPEELRWTKKPKAGKPRMLLAVDKIPANALPFLLEDPAFKVVSE